MIVNCRDVSGDVVVKIAQSILVRLVMVSKTPENLSWSVALTGVLKLQKKQKHNPRFWKILISTLGLLLSLVLFSLIRPLSLLKVMHRRSIDSLNPLSASVPAAKADIKSVFGLTCCMPSSSSSSFLLLFSFLLPYFSTAASKHLRLSHPVLNAGGVIKRMNKPAASSQTLPKYSVVLCAETRPDILSEPSASFSLLNDS